MTPSYSNTIKLTAVQQAHLVLQTIKRFCQSADPAVSTIHVPRYGRLLGATPAVQAEVRDWSVMEASHLWKRMVPRGDDVPLGHDGYLKLWAIGNPRLPTDFILLDEAQDTNQVVLSVLQAQASQMVYVSDTHQQIYEWRGAINAMEQVTGCEETSLTQSFRFGETIASAASRVIATLGERRRLRGNPAVHSSIRSAGRAQAVPCRTNASVIIELLGANDQGLRPHIVGGTHDLERLLGDVFDLKEGNRGQPLNFSVFRIGMK